MADQVLQIKISGDSSAAVEALQNAGAQVEVASGAAGSAGKKATDSVASEAENDGGKLGQAFEDSTSKLGTVFSKLANFGSSWGLPFTNSLQKLGAKFDAAKADGGGLVDTLKAASGLLTVAAAAGLGAAAGECIHLAETFEQTEASIAANADISTKAADEIGNAFLNTAGKTVYSGQQIAQAYSGIAGLLGSVEGHALTAAQAMQVMQPAMDLAEATDTSLTSAAKDVATVMQLYGLSTDEASKATDQLYMGAKLSGNSVDSFTSTLQRMHTQLGTLTPPLGETSALLADMAEQGESGRRALSAVSTAMNTMLKPAEDVVEAQQNLKTAQAQLPPALDNLAKEYLSGSVTSEQLTTATEGLSSSQAEAWSQFKSAADAIDTDNVKLQELGITVVNAQGTFVGMASVISQLHDKIQGMTQAQALATLSQAVGTTAARQLLSVVEAGPAAYQKATDQVNQANSAHEAAEKQAATLQAAVEELVAALQDLGTKFGTVLLPVFQEFLAEGEHVLSLFLSHKTALEGLAAVLGGVAAVSVGVWVDGALTSLLQHLGLISKATSDVEAAAKPVEEAATALQDSQTGLQVSQEAMTTAAGLDAIGTTSVGAGELAVGVEMDVVDGAADAATVGFSVLDTLGAIASAPVALVVGIIAVAGASIWAIVQYWGTLSRWVADNWQYLFAPLTYPVYWLINNWDTCWRALDDTAGAIVGWFEGLPGHVVGMIDSAWDFVTQGVQDLESGFVAGLSSVLTFFKSLGTWIVDALKFIPTELLSLGKDLVDGIKVGIDTGAHWVMDGLKSVGSHIVGFFKGILGIGSPSKVTETLVGTPLMQSVAEFTKNGVQVVKDIEAEVTIANSLEGKLGPFRSTMQAIWSTIAADLKNAQGWIDGALKQIDFVTQPTASLKRMEASLSSGWSQIDADEKTSTGVLNSIMKLLDMTPPEQSLNKLLSQEKSLWPTINKDTAAAVQVNTLEVQAATLSYGPDDSISHLASELTALLKGITADTSGEERTLQSVINSTDLSADATNSIENWKKTLKAAWSKLNANVKSLLDQVVTTSTSDIRVLVSIAPQARQTLDSYFTTSNNLVKTLTGAAEQRFRITISNMLKQVAAVAHNNWTALLASAKETMSGLSGQSYGILTAIYAEFQDIGANLLTVSESRAEGILQTLTGLASAVYTSELSKLTAQRNLLMKDIQALEPSTDTARNQLTAFWNKLLSSVRSSVSTIGGTIGDLEAAEKNLQSQTNTSLTSFESSWNQLTNSVVQQSQMLQSTMTMSALVTTASGSISVQQIQTMLNYMLQHIGASYSEANRWGTDTFDCSSLVYRAAQAAGINMGSADLANTEANWAASVPGAKIITNMSQLQSGDLVFFTGAAPLASEFGPIGHVGMYVGGGTYVSALGTQYGVTTSDMAGSGFVVGIQLAAGGIVTSPTTALVGEAGPELLLPLNFLQGMGELTVSVPPSVTPPPLPAGADKTQRIILNVHSQDDPHAIASAVQSRMRTLT